MKKYYVLAALALALSSCQQDEFLGNTEGYVQKDNQVAISFGGETSKITRTESSGETAAGKLNNKFVVFGYKTVGNQNTKVKVFDHYNVEWNSENGGSWEYIGKKGSGLGTNSTESDQTIKYWDYSATQYDFIAFSLGSNSNVNVTAISSMESPSYVLSGSYADIRNCYIANRVTVENSNFANAEKVKFTFFALGATSVNMGIYEEIPGYSIKEIKFYESATATESSNVATLYTSSTDKTITSIDGSGTLTVTFNSGNNQADYTPSFNNNSSTTEKKITFGEFKLNATAEGKEGGNVLSYTSSAPTKGTATSVTSKSPGDLYLKVDYTLISTDGSGEEITVKGATAKIPNTYTDWKNNCIYTYIFKITADTNGSTGGAEGTVSGLKPIQFDAVVTEKDGEVKNTTTWTEVKENGQTTTTDPNQ